MGFLNRPHMVAVPGWFLAFRILQIIFAVVSLGLASFNTWYYPTAGPELAIFTVRTARILGHLQYTKFPAR
jgi:hypothetical protein